jgi:uncharacterized membrane protein HdeD (DUF308 family)
MSSVNVRFWVTLIRAGLIMALGMVLLFLPDKTRPVLVNSMGLFWLAAGVVSLRAALADSRERGLPLFAGIVGVLVGVVVLTRSVTLTYGPDVVVIYVIAALVLLTGLVHVFRGFRSREDYTRIWSVESFLLGAVEIGLAVLLFIAPFERGRVLYIPLAAWALFGGLVLISQALFTLRQARQRGDGGRAAEQAGG